MNRLEYTERDIPSIYLKWENMNVLGFYDRSLLGNAVAKYT